MSSNGNLARVGREMQLGELLVHSPNLKSKAPAARDKALATLVEAVVGAVWIDSGCRVQSVRGVLRALEVIK